jgi:hypothetical protein
MSKPQFLLLQENKLAQPDKIEIDKILFEAHGYTAAYGKA